jgi:hypothetical protein
MIDVLFLYRKNYQKNVKLVVTIVTEVVWR